MDDSKYNPRFILKRTAVITLVIVAVTAGIALILGYRRFALAVLAVAPFGYIGLCFLAADVKNAFHGTSLKIFQFKFIFRLACFAILLYVVLVKLNLNPVGALVGIMIPILCGIGIVFGIAYNESKEK